MTDEVDDSPARSSLSLSFLPLSFSSFFGDLFAVNALVAMVIGITLGIEVVRDERLLRLSAPSPSLPLFLLLLLPLPFFFFSRYRREARGQEKSAVGEKKQETQELVFPPLLSFLPCRPSPPFPFFRTIVRRSERKVKNEEEERGEAAPLHLSSPPSFRRSLPLLPGQETGEEKQRRRSIED